jgi:superfamily II DNA/RNA helicase
MPPEIQRITEQFLHNPVRVEVTRAASTVATTTQGLVKCGREPHEKRDTLRRLIRSAEGLKNAIVFCNRKREVAQLHRSLVRHGFSALALHGDMDQPSRTAALEEFRRGAVTLLVASDVAARGLDIPDVSHVFNFDVPHHPDDYVHRIGRTGRAGRAGAAITLVAPQDGKAVALIEKLIGQTIPWMGAPPTAADTDAPLDGPREARGGRHGPSRGRNAPRREKSSSRHENTSPRQNSPSRAASTRSTTSAPSATSAPSEQPPASVTRLEEARPRRDRKPIEPARSRQEAPEHDDPALSHLPAFLLRPVRVKA